jgi:serine/threonine protein kinase
VTNAKGTKEFTPNMESYHGKERMKKKWTKAKQATVDKIKAADAAKKPEKLFTVGDKALGSVWAEQVKDQYRDMVKMVHPDANPDIAEAGDVMGTLNALHDLAQKKIAEHMWGKSSITITFDKGRTITDVEPFSKGDIGDIYKGILDGKTVVVKVGTSAADLIKAESVTLRKMYESKDIKNFGKYLPKLIDTIKVNGKIANIFEFSPKTFTLEQVIAAYPDGLDGKAVAWMWRRMLEVISWAHGMNIVHGAIIPSNILIRPEDHGLVLLDWCYSVPMRSNGKAYVEKYKDYFPPELFRKMPLDGGADLYMIAKCVQALLTGNPQPKKWKNSDLKLMTGIADSCLLASPRSRASDTWEVYESLAKNLAKLYGPPKFIPFEMPT